MKEFFMNRRYVSILVALLFAAATLFVVTQGFAQPSGNPPEQDGDSLSGDGDGEADDGENESRLSPSEVTLSEAEAISIAESETGSSAGKVELERERRRAVYSIEMADGSEVELDADIGKIIEIEAPGSDND